MKDSLGREIDYLRISVTDRCNYRCVYCMPPEGVNFIPHSEILSYEEIIRAVKVFAELGIRNIKLTGGEPLVRRGLSNLVSGIRNTDGIDDITLTSNGYFLFEQAEELKNAGLSTVNVSIDTMNRNSYARLCRKDGLDKVLKGIERAMRLGLEIRINSTISEDRSIEELIELTGYWSQRGVTVRYIELMPIGEAEASGISADSLIERLKAEYPGMRRSDRKGHGPSVYYDLGNGSYAGFIAAVHHGFCENCNRLRLTSDGFLKPCLASSLSYDIKSVLRGGGTDDELKEVIYNALKNKPASHRFNEKWHGDRNMNAIGG